MSCRIEEPPSAISAQLLAAAAEAAPRPAAAAAAGPGLWQRIVDFFGSVAHHPGLAAAATLLVVAGVAGTLYVTGRSDVAQPPIETESASSRSAMASPPAGQAAEGAAAPADSKDVAKEEQPVADTVTAAVDGGSVGSGWRRCRCHGGSAQAVS